MSTLPCEQILCFEYVGSSISLVRFVFLFGKIIAHKYVHYAVAHMLSMGLVAIREGRSIKVKFPLYGRNEYSADSRFLSKLVQ